MKAKNHNHALIWLAVGVLYCGVLLTIIMMITYTEDKGQFELFTLDGFLSVIGTFIAICTAIMLGAQIYSIYNRTQSEKEYDLKLEEVKTWFRRSSENYAEELAKISKATKHLSLLKYHLNEAMGGVHYTEGKKLEGIIDVMENVYTFTSDEDLFMDYFDGYKEKLNAACYFIAKNMKEYFSDKMVCSSDIKGLIRIQGRWNKRYSQLNDEAQTVRFIKERIDTLNDIFNRLIDGLVVNNKFRMSEKDWKTLSDMAKD